MAVNTISTQTQIYIIVSSFPLLFRYHETVTTISTGMPTAAISQCPHMNWSQSPLIFSTVFKMLFAMYILIFLLILLIQKILLSEAEAIIHWVGACHAYTWPSWIPGKLYCLLNPAGKDFWTDRTKSWVLLSVTK